MPILTAKRPFPYILTYIIAMEGIFSKTVSQLAAIIFQNNDLRTQPQLAARAHSLGLPIRPHYTAERIVFILAQAIANMLDEMVSAEGELRRKRRAGSGGQGHQGHSTLDSAPSCLAGNLNIAALVFAAFCPKMTIWDILDYISSAKADLAQEEGILEDVKLPHRIFYLPNLRSSFSCHCFIFSEQPRVQPSRPLVCTSCEGEYHGECQSSALFCNCCFLRFCLFDLREELGDAHNHNKEVELAYFSYIQNAYAYPHNQQYECIYFHIAKFDLPEMNNVQKKEKSFYLRLALVDRIFSSSHLPLPPSKRRKEARFFWDVDDIQYYFYLNHNELKVTSLISDYAVIFKLIPRVLLPTNNILVVKCVKRNLKYAIPQPPPFWKDNEEKEIKRPAVIMLGVYQTNRIKSSKQKGRVVSNTVGRAAAKTVPQISMTQAIVYVEFVLKKVNKIDYQIVDLLDISSREKIVHPVRSFSCTHIECFDFEQYKHLVRPNSYKSKAILKRTKKMPIDLDVESPEVQQSNNEKVISLDSEDQVVLLEAQIAQNDQVLSPVVASRPAVTVLDRKKEFLKRKRQKEKRERREKECLLCPICNKRMLSLYTDPLFKSILLNSGFYTKAKVFSNGEFIFDVGDRQS